MRVNHGLSLNQETTPKQIYRNYRTLPTPLHVAAEQGNLSVVQVMKSLPQISLELQDYTGRTPKQTALEQGYFQIAGMLDQPQHTHRLMDANGYRPFICDEPFNNIPDQMPQPGKR